MRRRMVLIKLEGDGVWLCLVDCWHELEARDLSANVLNEMPLRVTWHIGRLSAARGAMSALHAELAQIAAALASTWQLE